MIVNVFVGLTIPIILIILIMLIFLAGIVKGYSYYQLIKRVKRYPKIYKGIMVARSSNYPLINQPFRYFRYKIIFRKSEIIFNTFSKRNFNKDFNELYNYNAIKETGDRSLILLTYKYKRSYWFFNFALFLFFLFIVISIITLFIILLIKGDLIKWN